MVTENVNVILKETSRVNNVKLPQRVPFTIKQSCRVVCIFSYYMLTRKQGSQVLKTGKSDIPTPYQGVKGGAGWTGFGNGGVSLIILLLVFLLLLIIALTCRRKYLTHGTDNSTKYKVFIKFLRVCVCVWEREIMTGVVYCKCLLPFWIPLPYVVLASICNRLAQAQPFSGSWLRTMSHPETSCFVLRFWSVWTTDHRKYPLGISIRMWKR